MALGGSAGSEPNTPNLEDLLRLGISAAKAGNKQSARMMLQQVLNQDKRNERAWLWLASVEDDAVERRRILQTVLELNPNNANAQRLLAAMDSQVAAGELQSMQLGVRILIGIIALLAIVFLLILIF